MGLFKPASMDKECDKAARILKGFVGEFKLTLPGLPRRFLLLTTQTDKGKIPREVIANAQGLAIFSGFRAAMYLAGNSGSGLVVARLPDGTWSPPSSFSVRTGGFGLAYGVDVYDCVCVLNTRAAVEAYTKPEVQLGAGIALAAGPIGGTADTSGEVKPVWTYTKSKGVYGGLTVDGTIITERPKANEAFYQESASAAQILGGMTGDGKWPGGKHLSELLKVAEGKGADVKVLQDISSEPTPGDLTR